MTNCMKNACAHSALRRILFKTLRKTLFLTFLLGLALFSGSAAQASSPCTYTDWRWDSYAGKAVDFKTVSTTKDRLTDAQTHPELPCSICREDMLPVSVEALEPVLMCRVVARAVEDALRRAVDQGFVINSLTGYRVGRTKGPLDNQGRRTQYSHHSFGLAIDINAENNGLYDRCLQFGPACRLRRGGVWNSSKPAAITPQSPVYKSMESLGFKWGGELPGRQKDFMHFSLSGD